MRVKEEGVRGNKKKEEGEREKEREEERQGGGLVW